VSRSRSRATAGRALSRRALLRGLGAAALAGVAPRSASAEAWGGITPGESTRRDVEALYGRPSRERNVVEEERAVVEWTYAGELAPRGIERMVVSYGLIGKDGRFLPDLVRSVALYPRPHIFSKQAIVNGWGQPDGIGTEEATGRPSLHYRNRGLLIILDRTGEWAEFLLCGPRALRAGS